jgi:hypothetical protein
VIYAPSVLRVLRNMLDNGGRSRGNDEFERISLRRLSGEEKARPEFRGLVRFNGRGASYNFVLTKKGEAVARKGRDVDETLDRLRDLQSWLSNAVTPDAAYDVALEIAKLAKDLDEWLSDEGEWPEAWSSAEDRSAAQTFKGGSDPPPRQEPIVDAILEEDS